jgi:hypothetical protein
MKITFIILAIILAIYFISKLIKIQKRKIMEKEKLRAEYMRLNKLATIEDCLDLFDIFLEHLWNVIQVHHKDKVDSYANKDAKMINQMMFTKLTHLKKIVEGVGYTAKNGDRLNKIVDPTIVASLTRNVFETVSVFNLIYINTKSDDEKTIIYNLWVTSGLKYRQRFQSAATTPENIQKMADEQKQIDEIEIEIKDTALYKSLDATNQKKIDDRIKKKDFQIRFNGKEVVYLSWQDMCDVMGLNHDIFDNIYTYFSLYSHPSEVAVFQFESMFSKENEEFKQLTTTNLKYCFSLMSVFVADYISHFPQVKDTFEKLEIHKQIAINAHNKMLRGDAYSINDSWKNLE